MKEDVLATAIKAAYAGGKILNKYFGSPIAAQEKEDGSFVSMVDQTAERTVLNIIRKKFPRHSIFSEEVGLIDQKSDSLWLVDPLDGTTNFLNHLPYFCVSVAYEAGGILEVGVIYDPLHDELFYSERGKGAFLNKERLRLGVDAEYKKSLVAISRGRAVKDKKIALAAKSVLEFSALGTRWFGSAALELAHLAAGRFGGFVGCGLKRYDVAAGLAIAEEAGARIFNFGKENDFSLTGSVYVAAAAKNIAEPLFRDLKRAIRVK